MSKYLPCQYLLPKYLARIIRSTVHRKDKSNPTVHCSPRLMAGVGSGVYLTPPSDSPKNSLRLGFRWLASLFGFPFLFLFDFVWDSSDLAPMARNPACSVYIGNLDEKVSERVLYEILIQVGHVVDLHIPRDKETNRHKGYAFAEYETEETANYAVRLFSGLVRLHNKTLKFAMSGQDKSSQNSSSPLTPQANCPPLPNNGPSPFSVQSQDRKLPQVSAQAMVNCRISSGAPSVSLVYPQVYSNGLANNGLSTSNYEYNRRVFGDVLNSVSRPATSHLIAYPSY